MTSIKISIETYDTCDKVLTVIKLEYYYWQLCINTGRLVFKGD